MHTTTYLHFIFGEYLIDYIIRMNSKFLIILYHTNYFIPSVKIVPRGDLVRGGGKIAKCRRLFLGGGGHFAEIPMVADGRGVEVKNRENLPTS